MGGICPGGISRHEGKRRCCHQRKHQLLGQAKDIPVLLSLESEVSAALEDGGNRYCLCRGPNDGSFMVECDVCQQCLSKQDEAVTINPVFTSRRNFGLQRKEYWGVLGLPQEFPEDAYADGNIFVSPRVSKCLPDRCLPHRSPIGHILKCFQQEVVDLSELMPLRNEIVQ